MDDFIKLVAAFIVANLLTEWIKKRFMSGTVNSQENQTTDTEPQTFDEYAENLINERNL
jgi:hypothetical protein